VRAVFALGHVGTDDAIEGLVECLEGETGPSFTFAVRELGRLRARQAIPALVGALDGSSKKLSEGDKRVIIYALAQMPHRSVRYSCFPPRYAKETGVPAALRLKRLLKFGRRRALRRWRMLCNRYLGPGDYRPDAPFRARGSSPHGTGI